ncbi:efflux RND transporter permease subunit [uncultured Desulfosarcina sp.]|uniref:efflux RND transporter permease subunit n=1 Tax=uncultured Desulfosarcina sp. TaxID=218289 RepID=UPI0029C755BB|nr:efflux RND transporter permease subunit [uncultured Desulfosarcina sp.]
MQTHIPENSDRGPLAWMVGNSVIANLLMFVFLVGGLIVGWNIKQEVFPDFTMDTVNITVAYPGASPEEVENGIILAIEEAIGDLEGVDEITSTASEGGASISVDVMEGADVMRLWQEIKSEVDRIDTFPDEAEDPQAAIAAHKREVLTLALSGSVGERTLRSTADRVRDVLLENDHITQVELTGIKDHEIQVEIPQATLRRYGLTLGDASDAIAAASVELGGGSLKTGGGDILVRVKDRRDYASEYARLPLLTQAEGSRILLGDVATVREGFEDSNTWARFDGQPAVMIDVYRVGDQTPTEVADAAKGVLEKLNRSLPEGLSLTLLEDRSEIFVQRAELLTKNALQGLVLVFVFLALFLETRLAFWVSLGIPISFIGSFIFLSAGDFSINMISMFAFIVTLGIVVDDAVVVGENIYHWRRKGLSTLQASVAGTREVAMPVVFSVLTNMVSFMPLMFVPGFMGKIFKVIPLVVAAVFGVSLIESLFILPAHLGHRTRTVPVWPLNYLERWQARFSLAFERFVRERYGAFLAFMVRQRYAVLAFGIFLMLALGGYVASGRMGLEMFPRSESDFAYASATLAYGSPESRLKSVETHLVETAQQVIAENGGSELAKGVLSNVSSNTVSVRIFLTAADRRPISTSQVVDRWRRQAGTIAGLETLRFESNMGGPGAGKNLTVMLSHTDTGTLESASRDLAEQLAQFAIVHDIDDGSARGKRQFDIQLLPLGERMGLTSQSVAQQVRYAFQGAQAVHQQRGRNEVTVRVSLPEQERTSEATLENLILRVPEGEVFLRDAVKMTAGRAYTTIERTNGRRDISVTANVDPPAQAENILGELKSGILPDLIARYPGLTYSFEGHQADMRESLSAMLTGSLLALFGIYALLAVPFRSYAQPLIIMVSIPFGIIGAILGHLIMGYSLSLNSLFGVVALSGVVVNDSLVLIDMANRNLKKDMKPLDAVLNAGVQRFRPILLTTVTTFGGLMPMIMETSFQARMMIPMAISLGFGVLFATLITLVLVPSLYLIVDDLARLMGRRKDKVEHHGQHAPVPQLLTRGEG